MRDLVVISSDKAVQGKHIYPKYDINGSDPTTAATATFIGAHSIVESVGNSNPIDSPPTPKQDKDLTAVIKTRIEYTA